MLHIGLLRLLSQKEKLISVWWSKIASSGHPSIINIIVRPHHHGIAVLFCPSANCLTFVTVTIIFLNYLETTPSASRASCYELLLSADWGRGTRGLIFCQALHTLIYMYIIYIWSCHDRPKFCNNLLYMFFV